MSGYIVAILNPLVINLKTICTGIFGEFVLKSILSLTNANPFLELKIASPLIYGIFSVSFFYMLKNGLKWSNRLSLFCTFLLILQPAILRLGWDALDEELAFSFFFILIGIAGANLLSNEKLFWKLLLTILIFFTEPLVAVLLTVVFAFQLVKSGIIRKNLVTSLTLCSVVLFLLLLTLIEFAKPNLLPSSPSLNLTYAVRGPQTVPLGSTLGISSSGLVNYFQADGRFIGGSYQNLLEYIFSLSIYTTLPLIIPSVYGFYKDKIAMPMTIFLLIAGYSIVVIPTDAIPFYNRWILLLPIPLTFYATNGFNKLTKKIRSPSKVEVASIILACMFVIGGLYSVSTILPVNQQAGSYIPKGLSATAFPLEEIPGLQAIDGSLNSNLMSHSAILTNENYEGYLKSNLDQRYTVYIVPSQFNIESALSLMHSEVNGSFYVVWYAIGNSASYNLTTIIQQNGVGLYLL